MDNPVGAINMSEQPWLICKCGGHIFLEGLIAKRISPIISKSGKEEMYPVSIIYCKDCGKLPDPISAQIPGCPAELKHQP